MNDNKKLIKNFPNCLSSQLGARRAALSASLPEIRWLAEPGGRECAGRRPRGRLSVFSLLGGRHFRTCPRRQRPPVCEPQRPRGPEASCGRRSQLRSDAAAAPARRALTHSPAGAPRTRAGSQPQAWASGARAQRRPEAAGGWARGERAEAAHARGARARRALRAESPRSAAANEALPEVVSSHSLRVLEDIPREKGTDRIHVSQR